MWKRCPAIIQMWRAENKKTGDRLLRIFAAASLYRREQGLKSRQRDWGRRMEIRKGYVEHIVFRNPDNGYSVFQLTSEEEELTCVGIFPMLAQGEFLEVGGA